MKQYREKLTVWLFCAALLTMLAGTLLCPREAFSALEKRWLAGAPTLSWDAVSSGRFSDQAESWAADHLPGREALVECSAWADRLCGLQRTKEILVARNGRLLEAPISDDPEPVVENVRAVAAFAETAGCPVSLMLVPSAGAMLEGELPRLHEPYPDRALLAAAREACGEVRFVDLASVFAAQGDVGQLYYRTDHHWTSRGAWLAAGTWLEAVGRTLPDAEQYRVTAEPGFTGSTWSRAAFWEIPREEIELWDSGGDFLVENADRAGSHEGLFYPEHLGEPDKYPVFLDGNHSLVRIRNRDAAAAGKLLVIRDSFANSLGCFLAEGFEETVLLDLRYYRGEVAALLASEGFDEILVVYSLSNFASDRHLSLLEA